MSTATLNGGSEDQSGDFLLISIGSLWGLGNMAAKGIDLWTMLPPILIGLAALLRAAAEFVKVYRSSPPPPKP